MKNLFLIALLTFLIISCSSDDGNSPEDYAPSLDTHLISRVYLHEYTERHVNYTYNSNNQLIEGITSDGSRQTFAYHSNGLIRENAFYNRNQEWTGTLVLDYNIEGNINKLFFLDSTSELVVSYLNDLMVELSRMDVTTNEVYARYLMEMNNNKDVSNLKIFNSDDELIHEIDFLYDLRGNVNRTIDYDVNSSSQTILDYEWGTGLTYHYNQASLLYQRMPNGMSLSDFIDLADGNINLLGNGMNPRLNHDTFRAEYTYYSNGLAKTQDFIYYNGENQFEPNSFTYEYINKN